jgi:hypothetical protein
MGKDKENKGDFSKYMKSCENPRSPGKPFLDLFPLFISRHSPLEKVASLQPLGVISPEVACGVLQIPGMSGAL